MKYMGGKTALLGGELGEILLDEAADAPCFVDLFAGSGAVGHFMAQRTALRVLSVDLQEYARVLAAAVIERTASLVEDAALATWLSIGDRAEQGTRAQAPLTAALVEQARVEAAVGEAGFITKHYGGHYFAPDQARVLDLLYGGLPESEPARTVALAALLRSASVCAAAPGHTAQPFQPTASLLPYIQQAWSKSVTAVVGTMVEQLAPSFARTKGEAIVGDAQSIVATLSEGDLVFCDPPYSAVQYSRFYHVLEGIARGGWDEVSGNGRAPARISRRTSEFSMKSKAPAAMNGLLSGLRERKCRVVITFPNADASNGLSGQDIITMASEGWLVKPHYVDSIHSTLGGSKAGSARGARRKLKEAVIVLAPKSLVVNIPMIFTDSVATPIQDRVAVPTSP